MSSPPDLSHVLEQHLRDYFASQGQDMPSSGLYERVIQEIERPLLSITLDECRGNQLRAAAVLGLNRNTLRKKIRELGLKAGRKKPKGVRHA
ncbi:MAG: helix-turn-helix domain-containing protein [Alphaproteobacteria bacterium]|nr:helix-turn-helix domain-containing protein [Alphaproteobacteria bacterium]